MFVIGKQCGHSVFVDTKHCYFTGYHLLTHRLIYLLRPEVTLTLDLTVRDETWRDVMWIVSMIKRFKSGNKQLWCFLLWTRHHEAFLGSDAAYNFLSRDQTHAPALVSIKAVICLWRQSSPAVRNNFRYSFAGAEFHNLMPIKVLVLMFYLLKTTIPCTTTIN